METLQEIMKKALAETFAFYLKTQNYHWNVEGMFFSQLHDFFGKIYNEVYDSVDSMAEEIRTLDTYAPGSFTRFLELSEIQCELNVPEPKEMISRLIADNQILLSTLNMAFKLANEFDKQGLADFLAGRIDAHNKHAWMLNSTLK